MVNSIISETTNQDTLMAEESMAEKKPNKFFTITQTAEYLGISIPTVRKYIRNKELYVFKNHRVVRVPKAELDAFIRRQMNSEG